MQSLLKAVKWRKRDLIKPGRTVRGFLPTRRLTMKKTSFAGFLIISWLVLLFTPVFSFAACPLSCGITLPNGATITPTGPPVNTVNVVQNGSGSVKILPNGQIAVTQTQGPSTIYINGAVLGSFGVPTTTTVVLGPGQGFQTPSTGRLPGILSNLSNNMMAVNPSSAIAQHSNSALPNLSNFITFANPNLTAGSASTTGMSASNQTLLSTSSNLVANTSAGKFLQGSGIQTGTAPSMGTDGNLNQAQALINNGDGSFSFGVMGPQAEKP